MDAVSPFNVNASAPAMLDHGRPQPSKKAVSQDEASALALLAQLPPPQLSRCSGVRCSSPFVKPCRFCQQIDSVVW